MPDKRPLTCFCDLTARPWSIQRLPSGLACNRKLPLQPREWAPIARTICTTGPSPTLERARQALGQ